MDSQEYSDLLARCANALERNGFEVHVASSRQDALEVLLSYIPDNASIGLGGSLTLRQLEIPSALASRGYKVFDHWAGGNTPEEKRTIRANQVRSDVFISSANAVTLDGAIVNIDGTGNRVASMMFGPRTTILVVGANKVVPDLGKAIERIRGYAAPVNCRRLGVNNTCPKGPDCSYCSESARFCRITTIIEGKPADKEHFVVILVPEALGY